MASDCDILESYLPNRKDTVLSSASSGVSSGSPLSHSPAASQSSNSSLSPRQQSPVGWQHGSEGDSIWGKFRDDNNALPPPPGITDSSLLWRPHHGDEVGFFAIQLYVCLCSFSQGCKWFSFLKGHVQPSLFFSRIKQKCGRSFIVIYMCLSFGLGPILVGHCPMSDSYL